jgi:hypothetical protein
MEMRSLEDGQNRPLFTVHPAKFSSRKGVGKYPLTIAA